MSQTDPKELYDKLEELGEEEVRNRLASNAVYGGDKKDLVAEWLRRKAQERDGAVEREQIEIARSTASSARDAANSARDTAREAREANRIAKRANKIAITAIIAAIISATISLTSS